jgi:hypothetical protein
MRIHRAGCRPPREHQDAPLRAIRLNATPLAREVAAYLATASSADGVEYGHTSKYRSLSSSTKAASP